MPIPVMQQDLSSPEPRSIPRLVQVSAAVAIHKPAIYSRILAHIVDGCVLAGFSVYIAKIFSVLLIAFHGNAINSSGSIAAGLFRQAFNHSSSHLFAASFAATSVLYFIGLPLIFGRTPGQGIFGLRTLGDQGEAPTLRNLSYRLAAIAFTYCTAGLICVVGLRQRDGRFFHDIVSGSSVFRVD